MRVSLQLKNLSDLQEVAVPGKQGYEVNEHQFRKSSWEVINEPDSRRIFYVVVNFESGPKRPKRLVMRCRRICDFASSLLIEIISWIAPGIFALHYWMMTQFETSVVSQPCFATAVPHPYGA